MIRVDQSAQFRALGALVILMVCLLSVLGCGDDGNTSVGPSSGVNGGTGSSGSNGNGGGSGDGTSQAPPVLDEVSVNTLTRCPKWTKGDKDVNGHGPEVTFSAWLEITSDHKDVYVNLSFKAEETRSDWTTVTDSHRFRIYRAPSGWKVSSIRSGTGARAKYVDTDHSWDYPSIQGSLVNYLAVMGDRDGADASNCSCRYKVGFETIKILRESD